MSERVSDIFACLSPHKKHDPTLRVSTSLKRVKFATLLSFKLKVL